MDAAALEQMERDFESEGLPAFCRRPRRRPRAQLLGTGAAVAVLELAATVPERGWPWTLTAAVSAASLAAVAVLVWASSHSRRRLSGAGRWTRHLFLAGILAVPPMVNAVAHAWSGKASTLWAVNLVAMLLLTVDDRTGLSAVARWALRRTGTQLRRAGGQLVRTVPLLTAVLLATFVAAEPWQVAADMGVVNLVAAVVLLGGVGLAFAVRRSLDAVADDVATHQGTPLLVQEKLNLGFAVLFTQGFTVAVAAALFAVLLTAFNALAASAATVSVWAGHPVRALWSVHLGGLHLTLTGAHLAVGALGAAFAALAFAVSLAGDDQYHALARDDEMERLQHALAERERYLAAVTDA